MMADENEIPPWARALGEEDWHFIRRFILASGSLKDVAAQYGISYPTVRIRLDRLIEKLRILEDHKSKNAFHQTVRVLVADGKLDVAVARTLLRAFEHYDKGGER